MLPKRKQNRLCQYDYSRPGAYFITICTKDRANFFWDMLAPTVEEVVRQMKGYVTKKIGTSIWQKGFHDHVVRSRADYEEIAQYIRDNPTRWMYDHYNQT